MASVVWTCIGQKGEFCCLFTTRYEERAKVHSKIAGHECIAEVVPSEWPLSSSQVQFLDREIRCRE